MYEPDFDRDRFEGQMNPSERAVLYDTVMRLKPRYVWEVGTCRGGGSTYYISTALENLDNGGKLITSEVNQEWYEYAMNLYGLGQPLEHLRQRVMFNFGDACTIYPKMLKEFPVHMVFIDGGEDSIQCLHQAMMFRPFMAVGTVIAFHDWDNGKTDYVRGAMENDKDWKLVCSDIAYRAFQRVGDLHK